MKSLIAEVESRLTAIKQEEAKLRQVLATLKDTTPKTGKSGKRTRHVRYKTTCTRCEKPITVRRNPQGKPSFCHKPCTSEMHKRDQKLARTEYRSKPATLLSGDPLRASH